MDFQPHHAPQKTPLNQANSSSFDNRRGEQRAVGSGELLVAWYHEPGVLCSYPTLDISESGARVVVDCYLPDGLTGLTLSHKPTGIRIDRPSVVAWCRSVRNEGGILLHYQAGIRFF